MNKITEELEKQLKDENGAELQSKIDELIKVRDSFNIYNGITIWPYNVKLIQTIVITYVLQLVLLIYNKMK
jgi:hypothetical protein